jgi:tRNA A-37 threonylcarbamoyl transferase component Bud32
MGNKWSATPSIKSETLNDDDGEPPDEVGDLSTLTVTLIETSPMMIDTFLGPGKHHALIRLVNTFNNQSHTKPLKFDNLNNWQIPKRRFVFASNDPEGEIRISLLYHLLPPLPALPNCGEEMCKQQQIHKEKIVLANLTIPVSLAELKQSTRIDRWYTIDAPTLGGVEMPKVRVSLDFNYKPSLYEIYDIEDTIGAGVSLVKKAVNKVTKKEYAVKCLLKNLKGQNVPRSSLENEIEILKSLTHPNIVQYYQTFEDHSSIYLITELVKGSDLFDITAVLGTLRPCTVLALMTPLLNTVSYLHSLNIIHHDIKPENIIVDYVHNTLKLIDFGSAKFSTKSCEGAVGGTLNYMAPEVLLNMRGARTICDKAVDVWSIGVLTFLLTSGGHPFDSGKACDNLLNRIISGKYKFNGTIWDKVPKECKDFIKHCLVVEPKKRSTVVELLKHKWIVKKTEKGKIGSFFSEEECELIVKETASQSHSRSNSMNSILELFSNDGVSRS